MNLLKRLKVCRQIDKSRRANGFNRRQLKKSMKEYFNRKLDIQEILSKDYSPSVVVDAYEYCMRKCEWDFSVLKESSVKDFLFCNIFDGEVGNGGIAQFLSNTSGDMAAETVLALERIDKTAAKLLKKALSFFPNGIAPKDCDVRNALIEQFSEETVKHLNELDRIIWEHDISQSCYKFLQAHKNEFLCF